MDNSTTTWIIVALLVLLIGAAIFMLLRRPGGDDSLDGSGTPALDRDTDRPAADRQGTDRHETDRHETDRRGDLGGRTAPEETQGVAPAETPARDDAPFDQSSYDVPAAAGGATPVDRADVQDLPAEGGRSGMGEGYDARSAGQDAGGTTEAARPADDFFGVDREPREEVEPDPLFQDPRTDGHLMAEDTGHDRVADEQVHPAPPAAAQPPLQEDHERPDHVEHTEHTGHTTSTAAEGQDEPLTADEVLDARDVADRDRGDGYAEPPVAADTVAEQPVREEPAPEPAVAEPASVEPVADDTAVEEQQDAPAGGPVFAESVYGPGSVEPAEDGSGPQGWEIKGNTGSMLFHTTDSPSYDAVRAEVWFDSEESARNAGFAHWDRRRR